jgi:serine/threonine protein kinase
MSVSAPELAILSRLLDEALDLDAAGRASWLDGLAESERHLEPLLREMLAENERARTLGFLSAMPSLDPGADSDGATARAGEIVGAYRLLREIGRGGMGEVWLAERADGVFRREIALKLPRLAWGSGLAQRMAREREIGALLEHPNIARLYDAGVDDRGPPFLALEHVSGQPIDVWCDEHKVSLRERLKLIMQVARAVSYAHGRLVVHRDLKPCNILVTADGQAHLLDFGIAKLLDEAASGNDGRTEEHGRVMTPHYASPEQMCGDVVTVQSDVFSLGVLAYELVCGSRPWSPRRKTLGALEESMLEGDAALASSRARNKAEANALRGEIDSILAKALRREPAQRYLSADAMASDIEHHLAGERVLAQPDRALYRLRKAFVRHRVGFVSVFAVMTAIMGGSAVAVVQANRAARSAERERVAGGADAVRSNQLRVSLWAGMAAMSQVPVRDALKVVESGRRGVESQGVAIPDAIRSQMTFDYATLLARRGEVAEAIPLMVLSGASLRRESDAPISLSNLVLEEGNMYMLAGEHEKADAAFRELQRQWIVAGMNTSPKITMAYVNLALNQMMLGRLDTARDWLDRSPVVAPLVGDPESGDAYAQAVGWERARLDLLQGRPDEALHRIEALQDFDDFETQLGIAGLRAEIDCAAGRAREGSARMRLVVKGRSEFSGYEGDPVLGRHLAVARLCALTERHVREAREFAERSHQVFAREPRVSPYFKEPLARLDRRLSGE